MDFQKITGNEDVDFGNTPPGPFLIGLLSAFDNRFQAVADRGLGKKITWKQFFLIICINLCKESPTINQLSELMGSSHQNVKQILNKLEKVGFVEVVPDERDKRKQRIIVTKECLDYYGTVDDEANKVMTGLFEGIGQGEIMTTIETIMKMERNLREL